MTLPFEQRPADSPFVESVWRSHSEAPGSFLSTAGCEWEMVVNNYHGELSLTVRGPETRPSMADYPAEAEWLGIRFKLGAFMPVLPPGAVADRGDLTLPSAGDRAFWLRASAWEFPSFDNIEGFVARLVREGLLVWDPIVQAALDGEPLQLSPRAVQGRFRRATGLTAGLVHQVRRAQAAISLLQAGTPITQAACETGYFDQAHLTRSLKRFFGRTPGEVLRVAGTQAFAFVQDAPRRPGF